MKTINNIKKAAYINENGSEVLLMDGKKSFWIPVNKTDAPVIGTARQVEDGYVYDFEHGSELYTR